MIQMDLLDQSAASLLQVASPFDYQLRVAHRLLNGENVVLRAPTGAGKTKAALLPFLYAKQQGIPFADRLVYAVPMRTLARSLFDEAVDIVQKAGLNLTVAMQMGSQPDDRFFEADITFTTIDQILSAYIGSPVSLPGRNANIVGAAVLGTYLVFDEFHLLEPDHALSTAIDLASRLRNISRVLLMSATTTFRARELICKRAGAEYEWVTESELASMPSQSTKQRCIHWHPEPISADAIVRRHQRRTIVVVNTVARAQKLYRDLLGLLPDKDRPHVRLLHARFLPRDRAHIEDWALSVFREGSQDQGILIATQVIEVGLNLSAQVLHTELAPASAIFQRAGRCARFPNERGDVFVYALPADEAGNVQVLPYEADEREAILAGAKLFAEQSGNVYTYQMEAALAEAAYGEYDLELLAPLMPRSISKKIEASMATIDASAPRDLIRDADSVSLAVHGRPATTSPRSSLDSFSVSRGTFYGFARRVLDAGGTIWALRADGREDGPVVPSWVRVESVNELKGVIWACVQPQYACYTPEIGLELNTPGTWQSAEVELPRKFQNYRYSFESYEDHIQATLRHYDAQKPLYAVTTERMAMQLGISADVLEHLGRVAVALHDVGKLAVDWQSRAWAWQRTVRQPAPVPFLAHTDQDRSDPEQRERARQVAYRLPGHASEGAFASSEIIADAVSVFSAIDDDVAIELCCALCSAIARHHGAGTEHVQDFTLTREAQVHAANQIAWAHLETTTFNDRPSPDERSRFASELSLPSQHPAGFLVYWLIARRLRLADQRATAEASR